MRARHLAELGATDLERLARYPYADRRYEHYRDRGHSSEDSLRYALAWGRNTTEQRARRLAHETGAVA